MTTSSARQIGLKVVLLLGVAGVAPAAAQDAVERFYQGETIRLIVGYSTGATFDTYARALVQFMPRHIPGRPSMIVENMPGAGSLTATNHVANVARRDGLVLALPNPVNTIEPLLDPARTKFDPSTFSWIGSMNTEISTCGFWNKDVATIDDLRNRKVFIGATGPSAGSTVDARTLKAVFGFQFEIVTGYPGLAEARLAAQSGEIDGHCGLLVSSLKTDIWDQYKKGEMNVPLQMGVTPHPELPDVPNVFDMAESDEDRQVLRLIFGPWSYGRPVMAPAGVPQERLDALRAAFDATVKDPDFLAYAKKLNLEIQPISAQRIEELVATIFETPEPVIERARDIFGIGQR